MPVLTVPKEVPLKSLPLETRIALRLVTLADGQKKDVEMRPLAKELGAHFKDVMKAVETLAHQRVIQLTPTSANTFQFEMYPESREALRQAAHSFNRHLKVKAEKAARARQQSAAPAHLPPITVERRTQWMEKGTEIAKKLGAPKLAFKLANCIARLGEEEVDKIIEAALLARKSTKEPAMSAVRLFFVLYVARRDTLIPAGKAA